jgi:ribonuclease-3
LKFIKKLLLSRSNSENLPSTEAVSMVEEEIYKIFQKKFRIIFNNPALIITAFKHRSYLNITSENRIASNERLEFLGDAVLDLVVTQYLYQKFPKRTEGQLSKIKSILVSKPVLAEIASNLSFGEMILINKGEEKTGGRTRQSILSDAFEAVIGALYLDQGLDTAGAFIQQYLITHFKSIMQRELFKNYKSILLEYAQSKHGQLPEYQVLEEHGPDHDKRFVIAVFLKDEEIGQGRGRSKKIAEQEAAKTALQNLGLDVS